MASAMFLLPCKVKVTHSDSRGLGAWTAWGNHYFVFHGSHTVGVRWYLIVVFITIFFMVNDVRHFQGHAYIIFGEMSTQILFLLFSYKNSLHILDISHLAVYDLQTFSHILFIVFSLS